jgi:23S rRNA A2030 N6-methylase RlmJ
MLSYRHAFHAGNYADVLKHIVLTEVLSYLREKEKPFDYIDTHAGAGIYSLSSGQARKQMEHEQVSLACLAGPKSICSPISISCSASIPMATCATIRDRQRSPKA